MRNFVTASFTLLTCFLAILCLLPAALIGYWAIDRKMPIQHVMGQFIKWESINPHIVVIQWSAQRNRLCLGQTVSWIYAGRPIDLPPVILPHREAAATGGKGPVSWSESISIPEEAFETKEKHILLSVRFTWQCNPLQEYWPLELDAPLITIPVPPQPARRK
jgi:hypothetical protein